MLTRSGRRPTTWWKAINTATCGTASHMAVEWIIQVSQEVLQRHVLDVAGLERHGGLPRFHGEALRHATQLITGSKRYRMLLVRERQLGEDNGGAVAGRQWLAEHVAAKRTCEPATPLGATMAFAARCRALIGPRARTAGTRSPWTERRCDGTRRRPPTERAWWRGGMHGWPITLLPAPWLRSLLPRWRIPALLPGTHPGCVC